MLQNEGVEIQKGSIRYPKYPLSSYLFPKNSDEVDVILKQ